MHLEDILTQKHALLCEMVELTTNLIELAESTLSQESLDSIMAHIEQRGELMRRVEDLDHEVAHREPADLAQCEQILAAIRETLSLLNEQQGQISKLLSAKMNDVKNGYHKVKVSRRGLKGYYNQQVATTPSFIDKKR